MSKPFTPEHFSAFVNPAARVADFATRYSPLIDDQSLQFIQDRVTTMGLTFSPDEISLIASLNTTEKIQMFMDRELVYNNDHDVKATEETAFSPRQVLQSGSAHCFEGGIFAYTVAYLHGYDPRMVLLESTQDVHHNVVIYQDRVTRNYGSMAQSGFPGLTGRPAQFRSLRQLVESYHSFYYSERSDDPSDHTLIGYSEMIDLVKEYGTMWMSTEKPLWDMYYTYINDGVNFYKLFDDSGATHLYPMIDALKKRWVQIDGNGKAYIHPENLPREAFLLWEKFFKIHGDPSTRPAGEAKSIDLEFLNRWNTTPIDLLDLVAEVQQYVNSGFAIERLLVK